MLVNCWKEANVINCNYSEKYGLKEDIFVCLNSQHFSKSLSWTEKIVLSNFSQFHQSILPLRAHMLQSRKEYYQSLSEFILQGFIPIDSVKSYTFLMKCGMLTLQNFLIYFMDKNVISYLPFTLLPLTILMEVTGTPVLISVGIIHKCTKRLKLYISGII